MIVHCLGSVPTFGGEDWVGGGGGGRQGLRSVVTLGTECHKETLKHSSWSMPFYVQWEVISGMTLCMDV